MQAVILAGGFGTRIAEESDSKPKPMVEIGERPLLWHVMKIYAHHNIKDFVICLGYKGYMIKEFFFNYYRHTANMHIDLNTGAYRILDNEAEDWTVTLIDTGLDTMTGGRLKRVAPYLKNETFCLTYGDGLANIDLHAQLSFHRQQKKLATVTAVQPPGRFGVLNLDHQGQVTSFKEKPNDEIGWINGGFFMLEPPVIEYIENDATSWEQAPLMNLAQDGHLCAFQHHGFWQPCDTLRDKRQLEELWNKGCAPWKIW